MEATKTKMLKTIDELLKVFFEKIEQRFLFEISKVKDVKTEITPIIKYTLLDSKLLKAESSSFLIHFLYYPEETPSNDKDFFEEFMKYLKSDEIQNRLTEVIRSIGGEKESEIYMKILSEEIDNFMDVYNKVSKKYSEMPNEKENDKD